LVAGFPFGATYRRFKSFPIQNRKYNRIAALTFFKMPGYIVILQAVGEFAIDTDTFVEQFGSA